MHFCQSYIYVRNKINKKKGTNSVSKNCQSIPWRNLGPAESPIANATHSPYYYLGDDQQVQLHPMGKKQDALHFKLAEAAWPSSCSNHPCAYAANVLDHDSFNPLILSDSASTMVSPINEHMPSINDSLGKKAGALSLNLSLSLSKSKSTKVSSTVDTCMSMNILPELPAIDDFSYPAVRPAKRSTTSLNAQFSMPLAHQQAYGANIYGNSDVMQKNHSWPKLKMNGHGCQFRHLGGSYASGIYSTFDPVVHHSLRKLKDSKRSYKKKSAKTVENIILATPKKKRRRKSSGKTSKVPQIESVRWRDVHKFNFPCVFCIQTVLCVHAIHTHTILYI